MALISSTGKLLSAGTHEATESRGQGTSTAVILLVPGSLEVLEARGGLLDFVPCHAASLKCNIDCAFCRTAGS